MLNYQEFKLATGTTIFSPYSIHFFLTNKPFKCKPKTKVIDLQGCFSFNNKQSFVTLGNISEDVTR